MADQKEDGGDYDDQLDARASFKKSPRTLSSLSTLPSTGGHCLQTKADTDTDTDTEIFDKRTSAFDNVNPYLQVLKSNIRRLRKRLSRIKKTETVLAKGSKKDKERIQSEQYLAIEDKSKITVSIELLETLRETMADIASKASKAPQDPQDIVDNPNASSMAGQKGIEEKIQTDVSLLKSVIKLFAAHQLLLSPKSGLDGTLAECRETLSSICQSFVSCLDESVDSNERLMVQAKRLFEDSSVMNKITHVLGMSELRTALSTSSEDISERDKRKGIDSLQVQKGGRIEMSKDKSTTSSPNSQTSDLTAHHIPCFSQPDLQSEQPLGSQSERKGGDVTNVSKHEHEQTYGSDINILLSTMDTMVRKGRPYRHTNVDTGSSPTIPSVFEGLNVATMSCEPTSVGHSNICSSTGFREASLLVSAPQERLGCAFTHPSPPLGPPTGSIMLRHPMPHPPPVVPHYYQQPFTIHPPLPIPPFLMRPGYVASHTENNHPACGEIGLLVPNVEPLRFMPDNLTRNNNMMEMDRRRSQFQSQPKVDSVRTTSGWKHPVHASEIGTPMISPVHDHTLSSNTYISGAVSLTGTGASSNDIDGGGKGSGHCPSWKS